MIAWNAVLEGKVALVTGAGSGIGQAIAVSMAGAGARVVVADRDQQAAASTVALIGSRATAREVDVTDRGACDSIAAQLLDEHGRLDILVNNAGLVRKAAVTDDQARRVWDDVLATNLDGAYNVVTACAPLLIAARGNIVNIASIQSFVSGSDLTAYSVSKGGMKNLTFNLAVEFGRHGVRVNAIAPGFIDTPMTAGMRDTAEFGRRFGQRIALQRPGLPSDIADPVVFLASDMARYITGVTIPVDGGYLCS